MAESLVSNVAARIGELVTQEAKFLCGVEGQVENLQTELRWMKRFLKEVDSRQAEDEGVREWAAEIRDIAYDAEDVVETFALKIASKRRGGILNCVKRSACILREGWMLHKVKSDIEQITEKITSLTRRLQTYGMREIREGEGSSSSTRRQELRQSYPHIVETYVVGLDNNINELVSVLVDDRAHSVVASICGMGGLGKTTLAKKVFHHGQVRNHFQYFIWAYVSQQCQRRSVWKGISSSLGLIDQGAILDLKWEDQQLAEKLYNFLKENKCLLVLDDIWRPLDWDLLKDAFPMEETGSKVLLTSRNKDVALHADSGGYLLELQCLTDEDGWKLFRHVTFPRSDSSDYVFEEKMEDLGKKMVKQCAGLPLAIVVLGGILATKHSLNDWQIVNESVKSHLRRGRGWGIHEILALSYEDLPAYLKPCFLYLSVFPEDYEIPVDKLIQLWVAEDLVSLAESEGDGEEILEDVAERYLNELVERYMVLVGKRDASFKITACGMHDFTRDLCLSKAKQENLIFLVDSLRMEQANARISSSAIGKVRRLAIHDFILINTMKNPHLRSLLFFDRMDITERYPLLKSASTWMDKITDKNMTVSKFISFVFVLIWLFFMVKHKIRGYMRYICNNFKLLRVLDFEQADLFLGCKLLGDIGNLIHLRFLNFGKNSCFLRMPSSLGKLRSLQTLHLCIEDSPSVHVPNVLWRMERLRHLYLPRKLRSKTKLKLDNLRSLQTLMNFNTKNCYLGDLSCMKNLRKLGISTPFTVANLREDLNQNPPIITSRHLRSLSILNDESINPWHLTYLLSSCLNISDLDLHSEIRKLPELQHFSSNIAYFRLSGSKLDEDPMPTLGKLPNLRLLILNETFTGKVMNCSAQGFPQLLSLFIIEPNLEELRVNEGAMPNLINLVIEKCKELKMLPIELKFITTLKELKIVEMPKAFKDKIVEGGEDYYKVQQLPSVIFEKCDD